MERFFSRETGWPGRLICAQLTPGATTRPPTVPLYTRDSPSALHPRNGGRAWPTVEAGNTRRPGKLGWQAGRGWCRHVGWPPGKAARVNFGTVGAPLKARQGTP